MVCLEASARLLLQHAGVIRLTDARGTQISCLSGGVWITQQDDPRDIVLEAGQLFTLDRDGLAIIYGIAGPSEIVMEEPGTAGVDALSDLADRATRDDKAA